MYLKIMLYSPGQPKMLDKEYLLGPFNKVSWVEAELSPEDMGEFDTVVRNEGESRGFSLNVLDPFLGERSIFLSKDSVGAYVLNESGKTLDIINQVP